MGLNVITAIGFFCAVILAYVFGAYPLFVMLLGRLKRPTYQPGWKEPPTVTILFSAFNEENSIAEKIKNCFSQNYPEDKLNIIVADDASTDATVSVIRSFPKERVTLIQMQNRRGKTAALNHIAEMAAGEVFVFTDANALFYPDAIKHLVNAFDREGKIGVVCGELKYQRHEAAESDEESVYWNMEICLKRAESNLGILSGANGSIYALRKELFKPLREDMIPDFIGPLLLNLEGYRTVYQPLAISVESGTPNLSSEFRRKKRIIQRSMHGLWIYRELLNPLKTGWLAVQLWSHKVLRWLTPIWLLGLFVATGLNWSSSLCSLFFILQFIFYLAGIIGISLQFSGRRAGFLKIPAYFVMLLAASTTGIWNFLTQKPVVIWDPER